MNFRPVENSYVFVSRSHVTTLTVLNRAKLFKNLNAKIEVSQIGETLGDAILDLLKQHSAHKQMVKPLTRVKIQPGSSVSWKQRKH